MDLLDKLLVMDPDRRLTAEQALAHEYFNNYADPDDEVGFVLFYVDIFVRFAAVKMISCDCVQLLIIMASLHVHGSINFCW